MTMCKIKSWLEDAVSHRELSLVLSDDLMGGGGDGGSVRGRLRREGSIFIHTHTYIYTYVGVRIHVGVQQKLT